MEYAERRTEALAKLDAGDPKGAFAVFRGAVGFPTVPSAEQWEDAFQVFARIAGVIAGEPLGARIDAAARGYADPQCLYDTAYALYEESLFEIAATLLSRANELVPRTPAIVTELSAALEGAMLYHHAAQMLGASGLVHDDPWCGYLFAFNSLMSGSIDQARDALAAVIPGDDANLPFAVDRVRGMLARAQAASTVSPLDHEDLDGWHAVLNGGVLLHESVEGFSEAMRGRYAYVGDDYGLLRAGLESALAVLAAADVEVPRVIAAPDRSSRILAWAVAEITGAPLEPLASAIDQPGLVVVYDLDEVGDPSALEALLQHRPGQVLWAHRSSWTNPFPYTPDLTTFLYQHCTSPWDGGALRVDPEPDHSGDETIGARILEADPVDSHSTPRELLALVEALRGVSDEHAAGMFRSTGGRAQQQKGSPVPSNRFG
ncbi:MAG: hypothetical protein AB1Z98_01795 [Nannocystaceae bacterium]